MDYSIFVKSYKASKSKDAFIKKHITKEYLGYAEKMALAQNVARFSSHAIDKDGNVGDYRRDTMMQYFLTQMDIIAKYTDIEVPAELMTEAYDALSECGALNDVLRSIKETEITMVNSMVQMAMDDTYINEGDVGAILSTKLEAFRIMADSALSAIEATAEKQE